VTDDLGTFWFYEGQTLGFRFLHAYFPDSGVIAAMVLNSSPEEDRIGDLPTAAHDTLRVHGALEPAPADVVP
jgi:D-alanyl-D-alanine carboxypeptidase